MTYKDFKIEPEIAISHCKFINKLTKQATPIQINTFCDESNDKKTTAQNMRIYQCQLTDVTIDATYINSHISIAENSITGHIQIDLTEITNEDGLLERTPHTSDKILIRNNIIQPRENDDPIRITNYTDTEITNLLTLHNNLIIRRKDSSAPHILECEILTNNPKPFKFIERTSEGQITHTWQTGGGIETLDTNLGPFLSSFYKKD